MVRGTLDMESLKIKDQSSSVINIALTIYDPSGTYTRHAGVVIASVLRNTQTPVCFYILHDETLSADNQNKILETYCTSQQKLDIRLF